MSNVESFKIELEQGIETGDGWRRCHGGNVVTEQPGAGEFRVIFSGLQRGERVGVLVDSTFVAGLVVAAQEDHQVDDILWILVSSIGPGEEFEDGDTGERGDRHF